MIINVNDKMQQNYSYTLTEKAGEHFSTDFKNVNIIYSQNENFTLVKQVKQMPGIVYIAQIYIIIFYTMTNFKK